MKWKEMSDSEAREIIKKYDSLSSDAFSSKVQGWKNGDFTNEVTDEDYKKLRNAVYNEYLAYAGKDPYEIDLRVGLKLYEMLLTENYKLNPVFANNDSIWRFLSVKVFLDITYLRHPKSDRFGVYFSHDRVYKHTKRIWLKQLWWWVHLAWQGDSDSTYKVLSKFGSGCISQLLERSGKGYRIDITRPFFKKLAALNTEKISQSDFMAIMMLNYARMFSIEPTLVENGIDSYFNSLFDAIKERNISNGIS